MLGVVVGVDVDHFSTNAPRGRTNDTSFYQFIFKNLVLFDCLFFKSNILQLPIYIILQAWTRTAQEKEDLLLYALLLKILRRIHTLFYYF